MRKWWRRFFGLSGVKVMPKAAGVCPKGYSGRHVSSPSVDYRLCLNCLAPLT